MEISERETLQNEKEKGKKEGQKCGITNAFWGWDAMMGGGGLR